MLQHKERPYYKKPHELHRVDTCGTGFDWSCKAHEDPENYGDEELKNRFPWGTTIIIVLFFAFLIWDALYGGFNPYLFPGACG